MSNAAVIAYAAISKLFKYRRGLAKYHDHWMRDGGYHLQYGDNYMLPDFHILKYGERVISPETLSVEFLQQFNLLELRDILTLYTIMLPDAWDRKLAYSSCPTECTTAELFNHVTHLKPALDYVNRLIARINPDELINNVDLIRRNNELESELTALRKQLDAVKKIMNCGKEF